MTSVIIKSSSSANELQLSEQEGLLLAEGAEYYRVTLKAKDIIVSAKVYAFEPYSNLWQFFEDLAAHWRGWNGEKQWGSLEGEFILKCQSDSCGHIAMEIALKSGLYEDDWSVQTGLRLDAGQLEEIAANVKQFFSA